MYITVTSLTLRSLFGFFKLANHGRKIQQQAKSSPGFIRMKNTGLGYTHYTLSAWKSIEEIQAFARIGAHLAAMQQSQALAVEVNTYTYEAGEMPGWREAKELLNKNGKRLRFK